MNDLDLNFYSVLLAIISIALSLSNWIYVFIKNRRNITFELLKIEFTDYIDSNFGQYEIEIIIKNNSQKSISICYFELIDSNKNTYMCLLEPGLYKYKFQKLIDTDNLYERFIETANFPINLTAHQAAHEHIVIKFPKEAILDKCFIYTNTGKKINYPTMIQQAKICNRFYNGSKYFP